MASNGAMKIKIELTPSQILQGAFVGIMRQVSNLKRNRQPWNNEPGTQDWQIHIEGALGEMALAVYLDKFWDGNINDMKAADVGRAQARTAPEDWHRLILHEKDSDDDRFYLITGRNGTYTIQGWITGYDGKRSEFWDDPKGGRPAYFVPHSVLREPAETPAEPHHG